MKNNDCLFSDIQNLCNSVSDWLIQTSPKGNDRSPESNVPRSNLISKNMSLLLRNKLASLSHYNSLEYFSNTQGPLIPQ